MKNNLKNKDLNLSVSIKNVFFKYDYDWVLKNINIDIRKNEFLGIVGPNGGGKTTLLKLILGLLKPSSGKILRNGTISYVPQQLNFDKYFPISVLDVVLMGMIDKLKYHFINSKDTVANAYKALSKLGIENLSGKKFGDLSGGQKQRVLIARAIVNKPKILILDEPTANIDKTAQNIVNKMLYKLKKEHTLVMVSHNFDYIGSYVDRVACIDRTLHMHKTIKSELDNMYLIDHSTDENPRETK